MGGPPFCAIQRVDFMKKKIIWIVFIVLLLFIITPYIFVEINTLRYGEAFEEEYKQTGMIDSMAYFKVFSFSQHEAKIYYVEEGHDAGHFVWFEQKDEQWIMKKWETVWSEYGSASGITFPFYR